MQPPLWHVTGAPVWGMRTTVPTPTSGSEVNELLLFARSRQRLGELGTADELYCEALKRDPNCAEAWFLRSTVSLASGNDELAAECLRRAVDCSPSHGLYHCNLGDVLRRLGSLEAAERATRRAIELKPTFAEAHRNLALILRRRGEHHAARVSFETAWRLQPTLPGCAAAVVEGLRASGQSTEAIRFFHLAERHLPKDVDLTVAGADAFVDMGRLDDAISLLKRRVLGESSPGAVARLHFTLARVYSSGARSNEAITHLRKATELVPNCQAYEAALTALLEGRPHEHVPS